MLKSLLMGLSVLGFFAPIAFARHAGPFTYEPMDTPNMSASATGRYLYLGTVPRFEGENVELYISKTSLTLRVKAWVPESLPATYASFLLARWKRIHDAFQAPTMKFLPLKYAEDHAEDLNDRHLRAWLLVASQYMNHVLGRVEPLEDAEEYKKSVLTALLSYYLRTPPGVTVEYGLSMAKMSADPRNHAGLRQWSEKLFKEHLGANFTRDASRTGSAGYLTFVYPIAAGTAGPFSQPGEGVKWIGDAGSMDARWWSKLWQDLFSGMPFLLLDGDVAMHGPVTNNTLMNILFLERGYVSHGCHRMDPSDLLELRALLPRDFMQLTKKRKPIKAVVMEWPDVTDWNKDGKLEAMDTAYYDVPIWIQVPEGKSPESAAAPWMNDDARTAQKRFWKKQFSHLDGTLPSQNWLDLENGVFYGIPKYEHKRSGLIRNGYHEQVPIHVMPYRESRVIQYQEIGAIPYGFDDTAGKYPPAYFNVP